MFMSVWSSSLRIFTQVAFVDVEFTTDIVFTLEGVNQTRTEKPSTPHGVAVLVFHDIAFFSFNLNKI
jgi:hypothetical protein